jgi:hypothetical protein
VLLAQQVCDRVTVAVAGPEAAVARLVVAVAVGHACAPFNRCLRRYILSKKI